MMIRAVHTHTHTGRAHNGCHVAHHAHYTDCGLYEQTASRPHMHSSSTSNIEAARKHTNTQTQTPQHHKHNSDVHENTLLVNTPGGHKHMHAFI